MGKGSSIAAVKELSMAVASKRIGAGAGVVAS